MRNEAETRAELIDPKLSEWGWISEGHLRIAREFQVAPGRIEGGGRLQQRQILDYLLIMRDRKLAVLEAKAESKPLTQGLAQAKMYADKLGVRFAYCTNGLGYFEVDMVTAVERAVDVLPSPQELWELSFSTEPQLKTELVSIPTETNGGLFTGRYYQDRAIEAVLGALSDGQRRILLTLATGTGKTYIAFQLAWKLFQARWTADGTKSRRPRILFLADRNILANQAYNAFGAFDEDAVVRIRPSDIRARGGVPMNANVFITIFQTFMSGADERGEPAPYFGQYPPDFFDFIVVDECHRGGANDESQWRGILEYFSSAVQLGLTATPRRDVNRDTYEYFGEPVYVYSLKEGIEDGFLTPFRVMQISTTLDEYVYSPEDQVIAGQIDEAHVYTESEINKIIKIRAREVARVRKFMDLSNPNDKTLVFCRSQEHALEVRDIINSLKTVPDPNYCHRVTADDGAIGDQWLLAFQDNDKTIPTVLTTSEKLSTGVDALNIRNVVLLREMNSMVEFKQIIGRGTRLYEGKDYFTIYDFVKAHHLFSDPEWDGEPEVPVPPNGPGTPRDPGPEGPGSPRPEKIVVELGEGRKLQIDFMTQTTFWGPNGKQMSVAEFLKYLFGELPIFYSSEDELRRMWADPLTRIELLTRLEEHGFSRGDLHRIQELIAATDSDLFDVLAFISFNSNALTRKARASVARVKVSGEFEERSRRFIDFVLDQYVDEGVEELDPAKLAALLELRFGSVNEGLDELGLDAKKARDTFCSFQKHLYPGGQEGSGARSSSKV
jgi:type I restriction enzyme R subunit